MIDVSITPWQAAALFSPAEYTFMFAGIATGKTATGAHFVLKMIREHPDKTGFIGANTFDQLSQATLRELFLWLDAYGYDYVIDCIPPPHWGEPKRFKSYKNILSVRSCGRVVTIFTRVLLKGERLRGITISWFWIDETRDTPEDTMDVILARMRETKDFRRGLITTTTNGFDWTYERGCEKSDGKLAISMHVKTEEMVKVGLISQAFYDNLRRIYSPLKAAQELDAEHVNLFGGRAYYSAGEYNVSATAPWGDAVPDRNRPLLIGMDFNFSPAPCVWEVSQEGPAGTEWEDWVHTFGELSRFETDTRTMIRTLINDYPGFIFYRVFGDASGERGTTSNAGESDYNQIAQELAEAGCAFSIDTDQANPLVKDRVENVNRLNRNAMGETLHTYNKESCPLLHRDFQKVGWGASSQRTAKLTALTGTEEREKHLLTHASDALGYMLWKVRPFSRQGGSITSIKSVAAQAR